MRSLVLNSTGMVGYQPTLLTHRCYDAGEGITPPSCATTAPNPPLPSPPPPPVKQLVSGIPWVLRVFRGTPEYFSVHVPQGTQLSVALTPILGDPNLFVSQRLQDLMPAIARVPGTCSGLAGSIVSWCSALHDSELSEAHDHVSIPSDEACNNPAGCELFIAVASNAFTKASVVAAVGATPIRLQDGRPQQGQVVPGLMSEYTLEVPAASNSDLIITLSATVVDGPGCTLGSCSPELYIRPNAQASETEYTWHGFKLPTGTKRVIILRSEIQGGSGDNLILHIAVVSHPQATLTRFTVTAISEEQHQLLLDGTPVTQVHPLDPPY